MLPQLPAALDSRAAADPLPNPGEPAETPIDHHCQICPTCGHRLSGFHCKLVCTHCGYYLSCADYY